MKQIRKVIHVEFNEPVNGKRHHYFGSKVSVIQNLDEQTLGTPHYRIKLHNLANAPFVTAKCTIYQGELITAPKEQ